MLLLLLLNNKKEEEKKEKRGSRVGLRGHIIQAAGNMETEERRKQVRYKYKSTILNTNIYFAIN